jgi:hypothetical protein
VSTGIQFQQESAAALSKLPREVLTAIAAGIAVMLLPVFWFPYPPFHDLVAFVGMQSYPPKMSYGPVHYYGFQLTYFLHHLILRVSTDLGLGSMLRDGFFT